MTVARCGKWVEWVCHSGRKRSALQQEQTPDPFDRLEVKPIPKRLPYGVKVKSCVALAPEISTDEGAGSWVAYTVVGVWPEP